MGLMCYDDSICVGTFFMAVCAQPALPELLRVIRPGLHVVATVGSCFFDDTLETTVKNLGAGPHDFQILSFSKRCFNISDVTAFYEGEISVSWSPSILLCATQSKLRGSVPCGVIGF